MKAKEKRKVRGYKIADKPYSVAMKRAKKIDFPLASLIEEWVIDFGKYGTILKNRLQIEQNNPNLSKSITQ